MRFFKMSTRNAPAARPSAFVETMESRRLLSGSHMSGLDDGPLHDVNDNHGGNGAVEVIHNQRGRNGADDPANHDVNDNRGGGRGRGGADDGANHH